MPTNIEHVLDQINAKLDVLLEKANRRLLYGTKMDSYYDILQAFVKKHQPVAKRRILTECTVPQSAIYQILKNPIFCKDANGLYCINEATQ